MKFLADQDVYAVTVRFLRGLGHDVISATQMGLAQADDVELLRVAHEQDRILVTRDRDFGSIVFVQGNGPGVIYLRILPSTEGAVHAELERVLTLYSRAGVPEEPRSCLDCSMRNSRGRPPRQTWVEWRRIGD
jgi:predicted nuclease of predicted toxin-antitoxin system